MFIYILPLLRRLRSVPAQTAVGGISGIAIVGLTAVLEIPILSVSFPIVQPKPFYLFFLFFLAWMKHWLCGMTSSATF